MAATLRSMAQSIRNRGPDHSGIWFDREARVAFAHNRLAIIDVSPAGNQPMHSHGGRFVITFNGEIYNHLEVRERLQSEGRAPEWTGHSDTETLLAAIEAWGIEAALERSVGMFALGLWDKRDRTLILARDRLGEKPLYYGRQGGTFLFGSELKPLVRHPDFRPEVNREALALYLRYNAVPAPFSIYRGIAKLPTGCFLTLAEGAEEPRVHRYWSADKVAEAGVNDRLDLTPAECVDELERLLTRSVGQQMISDVPLGAFLSGGIDSSTVVALMQKQSSRPVKTFTIGFHEEAFDEAKHAKAVANHLGTDHTELYVTPAEAMDVLPKLPEIYDEPFADSSQIPTYLVSQLARRHVTVALSGDAGDELFGGYDRYALTSALWRRMSKMPFAARRAAAGVLSAMPPALWNKMAAAASGLFPELARIKDVGGKIQQRASLLRSGSSMHLYGGLLSQWPNPSSVVVGAHEPPSLATGARGLLSGLNATEQMMAADTVGYLHDDILVKLDRASMAVSLETRVPLLDHRLVEWAWRLPLDMKVRDGKTKWVLRQLLERHVPRELIERPKMGFGVPVGEWLKGPLRDWAEALIDERRLRQEGFFRPEPIRQMWDMHLAGTFGGHHRVWNVLMFQSWLGEQRRGAADAGANGWAEEPLTRAARA